MRGRIALAATALGIALLLAFGARLWFAGAEEMRLSDEAFHAGDLRSSLMRARDAGLLFVPGAPHVESSRARLVSIAKGAESSGDFELAFRAWDALRLVEHQTDYLGRGTTSASSLAEAGLARLRARKEKLDARP